MGVPASGMSCPHQEMKCIYWYRLKELMRKLEWVLYRKPRETQQQSSSTFARLVLHPERWYWQQQPRWPRFLICSVHYYSTSLMLHYVPSVQILQPCNLSHYFRCLWKLRHSKVDWEREGPWTRNTSLPRGYQCCDSTCKIPLSLNLRGRDLSFDL